MRIGSSLSVGGLPVGAARLFVVMSTCAGFWYSEFPSEAPPSFVPPASQGLVLGYVITKWSFEPAGGELPEGGRGSLRHRAQRAVKALVQGFLEYPVVELFALAEPYMCDDTLGVTPSQTAISLLQCVVLLCSCVPWTSSKMAW